MKTHYQVIIVGGGTAGISVAARLARKIPAEGIAVIDPAVTHYYQPLWTLVGGGVFPKEKSARRQADLIPSGLKWIRERVTECMPEENELKTAEGNTFSYDFLVVAPGIQIDWDGIKGLREALGREGVCSNYSYEYVDKTWEFIRNFRGGNALFTQPNTPVKCGGAPQKIAYLADDALRRSGVRASSHIEFLLPADVIFAVPRYAKTLQAVVERKGIEVTYRHNLVEVKAGSKEAVFENLDTGELVTKPYDLLHVTPPMSAPDFIKRSPLADAGGWVEVDQHTLLHKKYSNVFGIGDASNLPTSKTGAAIRKQAPVVAENLLARMQGRAMPASYNGYTSCPLVTGYNKLVLAEFDYDKNPMESFPLNQSKERNSMYLLKKYALPTFYWHGMLKGRM
jgi:sulfide:quinone oxidoreductase